MSSTVPMRTANSLKMYYGSQVLIECRLNISIGIHLHSLNLHQIIVNSVNFQIKDYFIPVHFVIRSSLPQLLTLSHTVSGPVETFFHYELFLGRELSILLGIHYFLNTSYIFRFRVDQTLKIYIKFLN